MPSVEGILYLRAVDIRFTAVHQDPPYTRMMQGDPPVIGALLDGNWVYV